MASVQHIGGGYNRQGKDDGSTANIVIGEGTREVDGQFGFGPMMDDRRATD